MVSMAPAVFVLDVQAGAAVVGGWRDAPRPSGGSLPEIVSRVATAHESTRVLLLGDVIARPDFPELYGALVALGRPMELETTGPALRNPKVLELLASGLQLIVRVTLYSTNLACHDWVARRPGEARSILRGIRAAAEAGLALHIEVPLTRSGLSSLESTVDAVAGIGASSVGFRLLRMESVPADRAVALGARVGLLGGPLAAASAVALRRGLRLEIRGLPTCALQPNLRRFVVHEQSENTGCSACDDASCRGLSAAYGRVFGALEMYSSPRGEAEVVELTWTSDESSREVRRRLVRHLEHRASVVRITGADALAHPDAPALLREAVRSAPRVEIVGDLSPILAWSDDELHRVRRLAAATSLGGAESALALKRLGLLGVAT